MATTAQTIAITQALLALCTAIDEIIDAQLALMPGENAEIRDHLNSANAAVTRSLENIQEVLILTEKERVY
jgi:hypothetical protein